MCLSSQDYTFKRFISKSTILVLIFSAGMLLSCGGEFHSTDGEIKINGLVQGLEAEYVYLTSFDFRTNTPYILDSAVVEKGYYFSFTTDKSFRIYRLLFNKTDREGLNLFLEDRDIFITGNMNDKKSMKVEGSESQVVAKQFQSQIQPLISSMDTLSIRYDQALLTRDREDMQLIKKEYQALLKERSHEVRVFLDTNHRTLFAPYQILFLMDDIEDKSLQKYVNGFPTAVAESTLGQRASAMVRTVLMLDSTRQAPRWEAEVQVAKKDTSYNVEHSSEKDHLVLLTFGASWCGTCPEYIREVEEKIQESKKDKPALTSIQVVLDSDSALYQSFVKKNMPNGTIYSRIGQGWDTPLAQQFGIYKLPTTIVIKKGEIIKRSSTIQELTPLM